MKRPAPNDPDSNTADKKTKLRKKKSIPLYKCLDTSALLNVPPPPTGMDDPPTKRRKWTMRTDDNGHTLYFCRECSNYLPIDKFYASTIKHGSTLCREHTKERTKQESTQTLAKRRKRRTNDVLRIRERLILYCQRKKLPSWSVEQVEAFLKAKGVDTASEQRSISIRPVDESHTFAPDNAQLLFRKAYKRTRAMVA